jgi:hypothetical protein
MAAVAQSVATPSHAWSIVEQVHELRRLRAGFDLDERELAQLQFEHPRLAQYLAIEPTLEKRLFKVLLVHLLEDSTTLRPILTGSRTADRDDDSRQASARAQQLARRFEQLRELVGTERAKRLQAYQRTLHLRRQIAAFDLELPPLDNLTAEQTERMVELMLQAQESSAPAILQQPFDFFSGNKQRHPFEADIWEAQKTIALEERALYMVEAVTDLTLQQLPQLLQPQQVRTYAKFQAAEINRRREAILRLRGESNLPDAIPEPPAVGELPPRTT